MRALFVKLLHITLGVSVVALAFAPSLPARAIQKPENDDIFDIESYNGFEEDKFDSIIPLEDMYPPLTFQIDFSVDVDSGGFFGGGLDVDSALSNILEPAYTQEEHYQRKSSEKDVPRADIQLSSVTVEPGAEITAVGQPQVYRSNNGGENLIYAWAYDTVALNGVAAGADSLDLPEASSPRSVHTRTPKTDSDKDGMDDDWELRYGLNPNDPGDADQDPDGDGFTNDLYANSDGDVLIMEPETTAGPPDGTLTNLKEYIWGTDPNNPDTDGDGFTDGQDIAGLGQQNINIVIPPDTELNDTDNLRLTILGESIQSFEQNDYLVKLDSTTIPLVVNDSEDLAVRLSIDNDNPLPGDQVRLTAALTQTKFKEGILSYRWFVNNVLQTEVEEESNFTFDYVIPEESAPGDVITFNVQAINFETNQQAEAELDVRIAELMQINYDPEEMVTGKTVTITSILLNSTDPTELVYHWYMDGSEVIEQSGQGKTTFTTKLDQSPGSSFDIVVEVNTPSDSKLLATDKTTITLKVPTLSLDISNTKPQEGEPFTIVAIPKYFQEEKLTYRWTVDNQDLLLQPDRADVTLSGYPPGIINIEVQARSNGLRPESASAEGEVLILPPTQISALGEDKSLGSLRASLVSRPINVGIFVTAFLAMLGIIIYGLRRRNALL